jgi:hypothetical protein
MRTHYDFAGMKGHRNPYIKFLKQSITIRLEKDTVNYFKELSPQVGMPYQNLINLYLRDCALNHITPHFNWWSNRPTSRSSRRPHAQTARGRG